MSCETLSQWVEKLRILSVDREDISFPLDEKVNALNMAVQAISLMRPDLYTETIEVELKAGAEQTLPTGVTAIVGDIRTICIGKDGKQTDGNVAKIADEGEVRAFSFFKDKKCLGENAKYTSDNTCSKWQLGSYTHDPRAPQRLLVQPPIPDGLKPKIKVVVQRCPDCFTWNTDKDKELPCKYGTAIAEYALYALYNTEQESEYSKARADSHFKRYTDLMGLGYRADSRYGSGYYLGQVGDKDIGVVRG